MPASHTVSEPTAKCHCGGAPGYALCCRPYIQREQLAPTAEALMRSRYSAFVECHEAYLLASWHPKTRPSRVRFDPQQQWLGLSIKSTELGGADDSTGLVEFVARFKVKGRGHRLHENSRFEKIDDQWFYLDGDHL
jgi:SEC-C motif-containing protein